MKSLKVILIASSICASLTGCNSTDSTANTPDASKDGTPAVATAEKAKCEGCGNEVPKAELASHDGKMMCKACIDAHAH